MMQPGSLKWRHGQPNELDDLLTAARRTGTRLAAIGDRLHFSGDSGSLSAELRERLRERKLDVVRALRGPEFREHGRVESAPFLPQYRALFTKLQTGELGVNFANSTHWVARLVERADLRAFAQVLRNLSRRHAILGARIEVRDGVPHFVLGPQVGAHFVDLRLRAGPDGAPLPEASLEAVLDQLVWRPFDLEKEPLFRSFIVRSADGGSVVGFVLHHLIGDAMSVSLLARAVLGEYVSVVSGKTAAVVSSLQYSDYLLGMNEWLFGAGLRLRLAHWLEQLEGARSSCLPADLHPAPGECGSVQAESAQLDAHLELAVRGGARSAGISQFTFFLTVYACVLGRLLGTDDLVILTMHHGRDHPALLPVVGSFQNQIPLRIRLSPDRSFGDLARRVGGICTSAHEQLIPYGNLLYEFQQSGRALVFPEFNFLDRRVLSGAGRRPACVPWEPVEVPAPLFQVPAESHPFHVLDVVPYEGGVTLKASYHDSIYKGGTLANLLDLYGRIARAAAELPDAPIATLASG